MALDIPTNLIFPDSRLRLYLEDAVSVNRTKSAVVLEGTRNGFLSLANAILFLQNDLEDCIPIHEFSFVDAELTCTVKCVPEDVGRRYGQIRCEDDGSFFWELAEDCLSLVASDIHSLGHLNPELHMDEGFSVDEISVYCVVE